MPFANPIVLGGGELAIPGIHSSNYVAGSEGWRIGRDGNAQFSNLSILGSLGATDLSVDSLLLNGVDLQTTLDSMGRGLVNYSQFPTVDTLVDSGLIGTTETIIVQWDMGPMFLGRYYLIGWNIRTNLTVNTDGFRYRTRYAYNGAAVSVASPSFDHASYLWDGTSDHIHAVIWTPPNDLDLLRLGISIDRETGTGTGQWEMTDVNYAPSFWCIDVGNAPILQTASQKSVASGSPDPDPPTTYTKTYSCTWSEAYDGDNSGRSGDNNRLYQGYVSSTHGNTKSLAGFDYAQIMSDLSGATVNSVKLTYKVHHAYWNAGMDLRVGGHDYSSQPSTWGSTHVDDNEVTYSNQVEGSTYTKTLPSQFGTNLKSGAWRGIAFGPGGSNSFDYYGYLYGNGETGEPKLVINYTK